MQCNKWKHHGMSFHNTCVPNGRRKSHLPLCHYEVRWVTRRHTRQLEKDVDVLAMPDDLINADLDMAWLQGAVNICKSGPICKVWGKKRIPTFVTCTPNASINSEILLECLAHINKYGIFEQKDGLLPFLLLDGHHSQLGIPFLMYIGWLLSASLMGHICGKLLICSKWMDVSRWSFSELQGPFTEQRWDVPLDIWT